MWEAVWYGAGSLESHILVQLPPLSGCVTLGKYDTLSEPPDHHLREWGCRLYPEVSEALTFTDSFLITANGQGERVWLPLGVRVRVRVTAQCRIWSLLPRTASSDAWNVTISDSCLWEAIALTPLSNNNNNPSWLLFAQRSFLSTVSLGLPEPL